MSYETFLWGLRRCTGLNEPKARIYTGDLSMTPCAVAAMLATADGGTGGMGDDVGLVIGNVMPAPCTAIHIVVPATLLSPAPRQHGIGFLIASSAFHGFASRIALYMGLWIAI